MRKIILLILVIVLISVSADYVRTTKALPPYMSESSYTGEPSVGNEIIVTIVIRGNIDRLSYGNTTFGSSEIEPDGSGHEVTDLFEIQESRIEMEKEVSEMTVTIPVKILRDGHGTVGMGWTDGSMGFGAGLEIKTEGYVDPPEPESCKSRGFGCSRRVGCAVEVPMSEIE